MTLAGAGPTLARVGRPVPPQDSAWGRFEVLDRRQAAEPYAAFLRGLEGAAGALNLEPALVGLAAELAVLADDLDEVDRRALTLLVLATIADVQQGSTRTPARRAHFEPVFGLLCPEGPDLAIRAEALLAERRAPAVIGHAPDYYRPLLLIDGHLYHQRLLAVEQRLAERLAPRLQRPRPRPGEELEAAIADICARPPCRAGSPVRLSDEQVAAVRAALGAPLLLVSGGPGTGKTSIVVALLRVAARLGLEPAEIALAAPTGKAAWRLGEAIAEGLAAIAAPAEADLRLRAAPPAPRTLHRLLGYSARADRFRHHPNDPLPERLVVVDESSMIDVHLMERLASALRPEAALVLLGDADQLPSVAAGAVFRDLLAAAPDAAAVLTESYRMRADDPAGAAILTVAGRVRAGEDALTPPLAERTEAAAVTGRGVEHLVPSPAELRRFLERWFREHTAGAPALRPLAARTWTAHGGLLAPSHRADLDALFAGAGAARLLCPTRAGEAGTEALNARLHALAVRAAAEDAPFLPGEPVLVLRNDYERGLFNGDQGLVLRIEDGDRVRPLAVFPAGDGYRAHPLDALAGRVELAYATTVHKAQGSELDAVAVMLPAAGTPLLTRELLYTAITRARRHVVLVGPRAALSRALATPTRRSAGLAERLTQEN